MVVHVPSLPRGCKSYLIGVKIADADAHNVRAIRLERNGRLIRKLSLNDLAKLKVDADGYHILKVE